MYATDIDYWPENNVDKYGLLMSFFFCDHLYRIRKEMVAYGNGFYLAMVDVNERVSGNSSRSKVLLHLICYKVWSSVGVEPSLFFDNIVTSMFE